MMKYLTFLLIANSSKYSGSIAAQLDISDVASTTALASYDSTIGFKQFMLHVEYNNKKNFQLVTDILYKQDCTTPVTGTGFTSMYLISCFYINFYFYFFICLFLSIFIEL